MPAQFLGTSGYHPAETRHTAGLLVPEAGLLMDAGSGTFRLPALYDAEPGAGRELDLVLTHAHLDHIIGLTFFIVWLQEERFSRIRVHARDEIHAAIERHLFSDLVFPVRIPFERHTVDASDRLELAGGHTLDLWHQPHRGITLGMRLQNAAGRSLAYCTDVTAREGEAIEPIAGVGTLIHECHFADAESHLSEPTGHSHLSAVARRAADAEAERTLLTHINPYYDAAAPLDLDSVAAVYDRLTIATDELLVPWDE